jgi:hypothetical protein
MICFSRRDRLGTLMSQLDTARHVSLPEPASAKTTGRLPCAPSRADPIGTRAARIEDWRASEEPVRVNHANIRFGPHGPHVCKRADGSDASATSL